MKIRKMRKRVRASKRISFHAELHSLMGLSFRLLNALAKFNLSVPALHKNGR